MPALIIVFDIPLCLKGRWKRNDGVVVVSAPAETQRNKVPPVTDNKRIIHPHSHCKYPTRKKRARGIMLSARETGTGDPWAILLAELVSGTAENCPTTVR
jgi:hypothetical protein